MEALKYKGTNQYPEIILDKATGRFDFSGNSLPEDAKSFYEPILNWIDDYIVNSNTITVVRFKMIYYNTPSSKLIFQILKKFEKLFNMGKNVKIIWKYNEEDTDIKEAGNDLAGHIKVPFEFEAYKE